MAAIDQAAPASEQKRRLASFGAVTSCLWTIIVLVACGAIAWIVGAWITGLWGPSQPPASAEKPPIAPNARNVVDAQNGDPDSRIITYDTTISPAEVYTFYEQSLAKDGWEENRLLPKPQLTSTGMTFEWEQVTIDGLGDIAYRLHILATATIAGTTAVQLDISEYDPRSRY